MRQLRLPVSLLLLFCCIAFTAHAQKIQSRSLKIGDPAPPLRVRAWLKGIPIQQFEKGKVYVVEFWATWCVPCIAAMPHLSALAGEYKDRVTILGMDVYEKKAITLEKVKAFVDSMGNRMDFDVATEDSNFMVAGWIEATGEQDNGIPRTFVVNADGRLAWIGHPSELANVLPKIVNNTWDTKEALAKRNESNRLKALDRAANDKLNRYVGDPDKLYDPGEPDSALFIIKQLVTKEPKLKYAPFIAAHTFSALLKTDPHKAYTYGKEVMVTPTYEEPPYHLLIGAIKWYATKLNLPLEIYELGADAYQAEIDHYGEGTKDPNTYLKMTDWYWRAKDTTKAIDAAQKAIEAMKSKKEF